jgi:outer membrane murein-binding lipoprotein Lpp
MRFCQTCIDFSSRFAASTEQLLAATSKMAGVAGVGQREAFEAATAEVQRLRSECDALKMDMKRHKSEHCDP